MRKHIPNTLTLLNLVSGCIATIHAFDNSFFYVVIWVLVAAVFDFLDGFAARILHVPSPIGKELDSLADVVSFGVAPAMAVFSLLRSSHYPGFLPPAVEAYIPYLAFIIPAFSALRLAKFNLDERQTSSFIGLPTPANALFWISYCCFGMQGIALNSSFVGITLGFILVLSLLLVSEIPMFSLKIKTFGFKGNEKQALLIAIAIVFLSLWGVAGIAGVILVYIGISIVSALLGKR
ncbi:MAG: CDP-alcohol phosphatidyltransferase family protein [Dysgonamonadaceae bacterium]|jgi:CDP-diacylglycerol--serine O-phosphatidyltransferase|nr:CDP-alcohol phosphatidyltransferase family protein [Dysgonamonadaceae bacterium]